MITAVHADSLAGQRYSQRALRAMPATPWRRSLTIVLAALCSGAALPYRPVVVRGNSMAPTLHNFQVAWMKREAPSPGQLHRGDVVIFRLDGVTYVKRIVALPGDMLTLVRFETDVITLIEHIGPCAFSSSVIVRGLRRNPALGRLTPYRVPAGHLFVMGDNECGSVDSRSFGPVPLTDLIGRVENGDPAEVEPRSLAARARSGAFVEPVGPARRLAVTNRWRRTSKYSETR